MDFFEVIKKRHCARKFNPDKPVKGNDIKQIIEAGKLAPSAGGFYPTRFYVAKTENDKNKILDCIPERMHWAKDAPIILVIWSAPEESIGYFGRRAKDLYIIQDAAAAAENIFLSVVALGLSTCWIGTFDDDKIKKALNLKSGQLPFVIMPIGYGK